MVRIAQFERRSTLNKKQMMRIARLTLVVAGALTMTSYAEARIGSNKIALVSPAELPELARMTGQAMTLHTTADGRPLPYVDDLDAATGSTSLRLKVKPGKVPNGLAARAHSAVALA
jgi:hypothetical protein